MQPADLLADLDVPLPPGGRPASSYLASDVDELRALVRAELAAGVPSSGLVTEPSAGAPPLPQSAAGAQPRRPGLSPGEVPSLWQRLTGRR